MIEVVQDTLANPLMLVPLLIFWGIFGLVVAVSYRKPVAASRLARHRINVSGAALAAAPPPPAFRLPRLSRPAVFDRLGALIDNEKATQRARALLKRAGSPMSLEAYARLRRLFIFAVAPLFALLAIAGIGRTPLGVLAVVVILVAVPRLPAMYLKRAAKKRSRQMDLVIADVLDLLVVCVEGGQSLPAALQQVSNRMDNVASSEFSYLLADINSGMSRREAFLALAERCQSEALGIACTTIVQADKVGMSIAGTLRTLSDVMRTRRRQAAETKARQAPIKMMPVLVGFMLPTMLALLLGPVALELMDVFK